MYKVFIVDDEKNTRDGLINYFNWDNYNLEIVGEADDGDVALEIIDDVKPDIVITDVKMPNMNGIELAQKLKEKFKKIRIIYISGYDDIEYIKSALKVDAVDYVLKPIDLDELESSIQKVIQMLNEEEKQNEMIYQMETKLMQSMPLLKEKFLMTLVLDEIENISIIEEKINFLNINIPIQGRYCVLVINIDDAIEVFGNIKEKDAQLISFSIMNICDELINQYFVGEVIQKDHNQYLCIINLNEKTCKDIVNKLAEPIQKNLFKHLNLSATIGMGKIVNQINELFSSYIVAEKAVSQKIFLGKKQIISTTDHIADKQETEFRLSLTKEAKLSSMLKIGNHENIVLLLNEIFERLAITNKTSIKYFQVTCIQLLSIPIKLLMKLELNITELDEIHSLAWESLLKAETLEEMKNTIINFYLEVNKNIQDKLYSDHNSTIKKIMQIIQDRYYENITVNYIANEVFLTSNYICKIFKDATGETIIDYLTKVRIEKAKEMLKDPQNKLYDICFSIGYSDPGYFSRIFKKQTGVSPLKYREKLT